jgi:hypothetical protein
MRRLVLSLASFGIIAILFPLVRAFLTLPRLGPAPAFFAQEEGTPRTNAGLWGQPHVLVLALEEGGLQALDDVPPVLVPSIVLTPMEGPAPTGWRRLVVADLAEVEPAYGIPRWTSGMPAVLVDGEGEKRGTYGLPAALGTLRRHVALVLAETRHPALRQLGFLCRPHG